MFPVSVAAYVVALVLVIAVVERVTAPGALPAALSAHGVVPRRAVAPVAAAVTVAEAVLAVLLLAGMVTGPSPLVFAGVAALFAGYGGYAWHVTASGRGGPCGCGGAEVPMGHWVTGRAFALAALAAIGAAAHDIVAPLTRFDARLVVVLLAAATIGTLLWHLPAATRHPEVAR
ncbi:MauE/DoxX family redox-associated membrane protein [Actinophytocola glycyrrhizae]|uniref:MauE/DoxX family redox-associated membrane protein n=1 Tax=Actinophytocola glycyrrhizae TaxID=2044873 RepID=A0ABV9RU01_9PSEU